MILKSIDDKTKEIKILKKLLKESSSEAQKKLIKLELQKTENGDKAEKDNSYYLSSFFKDTKNSILLNDIRIEHKGSSAQFDHILIGRVEIILLESKSFKGVLTIKEDNSLEVKYSNKISTFSNPVEQNIRHKSVLKSFLKDRFNFGNRFKLLGGIKISHQVLIHPETNVSNQKLPNGFVRGDSFVSTWKNSNDKISIYDTISLLTKVVSQKTIKDIANLIIQNHKPISFDYTKKYRVSLKKPLQNKEVEDVIKPEEDIVCPRCEKGKLIARVSNKDLDKYKSNKFLGCNRYPKCRYTSEIK